MTTRVDLRYRLHAPLALAWPVLADFGSLLHWVKGGDVGTLTTHGEGVGMVRDFTLPSVGTVQHRLDAWDEDQHLITYSLTSGRPLGMADYSVTIRLDAVDDAQCDMIWTGAFDPEEGAAVDDMAVNLQGAYQGMSERLDAYLATLK